MVDIGELLAWMALAEIGRGGTQGWLRAAAGAGSARALFGAGCRQLRELGLSKRAAEHVVRFDDWERLQRHGERCRALGLALATPADEAYPRGLGSIHDPPLLLYYRGRPPASFEPAVAIVGSRRATAYGRRVAKGYARRLAGRGVTVVSGLAVGIDAAAHTGALEAGATVAVVASGLDRVYPRQHRGLLERIAKEFCVLGEYAPGVPPLAHHFPVRNRIITGMTSATIVVEASERSGSLVSARSALDQGRDVYAVPGNVDSPVSKGTNALIRDGAVPLAGYEDLDFAFGLSRTHRDGARGRAGPACRKDAETQPAARGDAGLVLRTLESSPKHVDAIVEETRLDGARVLELLTGLELEGLAERTSSGGYARAGDDF